MQVKNPSERQEQECVIDWITKVHPWLRNHTIKIHNEGKCSEFVGKKLNAQGRLAGASDLFIAYPTNNYYGLFIEMKSLTGKPTKIQLEFLKRMAKVGYFTCCCPGADNAIATIKAYLANKL
jgi:hypothetical protein